MKLAYIFLANGFQETEAIATITVCRRAGIDMRTVSITGQLHVMSAQGVEVKADMLFEQCDFPSAELLVMPGGQPGSDTLRDFQPLQEAILNHYKAGRPLAAICAAPIVYGNLGILRGVRATCYPGFEPQLAGAITTGASVEVDGQFITAKGPGTSLNFGYAISEYLMGKEIVDEVKRGMMWPY